MCCFQENNAFSGKSFFSVEVSVLPTDYFQALSKWKELFVNKAGILPSLTRNKYNFCCIPYIPCPVMLDVNPYH